MPPLRLAELHPIVVHFPIALLLTSVVMDMLAIGMKRWSLADIGTWLLGFGVIGAFVAGVTGSLSEHQAQRANVGNLLELHQHFAFAAGFIFAMLLLVRLIWLSPRILSGLRSIAPAIADRARRQLSAVAPSLFAAPPVKWQIALYLLGSVIGAVLLGVTGYLGGALVYDHGLGIR